MRTMLVVGSLLLVLGCGAEAASESARARPPAQVEVAPGRTGTLTLRRTYLGSVSSVAAADLGAEVSGQVESVAVRVGDRVEEGDLLAQIDADLVAADVSAARAAATRSQMEAEQAQSDADRFRRAGARTVAAVEIARARTQAEALSAARDGARAELTRARQTLRRTRVTAPFSGVVSARSVDPGAWVGVGAPLLSLVRDDQTEVFVRVEPGVLDDVTDGHPVSLRRARHEAPATVVGIVRALDAVTRTAQLRLRPAGPTPWLMPGQAVDVEITLERSGGGVILPRDAIVPGVAEQRVFRVVDGAAEAVTVEVLERGVDEVRVDAEGLAVDDRFIVRGNDRLRPGQPVRVVEGMQRDE